MNWKFTLGLLVVAVGLGSYVFLNEAQKPAPTPTPLPGQAAAPTPQAINTFAADDVASISVRTAQGETMVARPQGGDWLMTRPRPAPADQVRVGALASQLATLNSLVAISLEGGRPASEYGLDPAKVTVTISKRDGTTDELTIGDQSPVNDGYFARKNRGNTVYVINSAANDAIRRLVTEPPLPVSPTAPAARPSAISNPTPSAGVGGITPTPTS